MSQFESQKTTIGEFHYEMNPLPPIKSHKLLIQFLKMVGPSIATLVDSFFKQGELTKKENQEKEILELLTNGDFLSGASEILFEKLDADFLELLMRDFSVVSIVQGVGKLGDIFDAHFMGRIDLMYRWLFWGMQVQWGKLLGALPIDSLLSKKQDTQKTQNPE